ncbi:MAG TPA: hypothetical protein VFB38_07965 [Chthonomonadaceae bacterium]|nr:hypothetical protein [Chthonomonadaceae bacterium]
MTTTRKATAFRFSAEAMRILKALAKDTGLPQTKVIELAIRDMAKQRGIELKDEPDDSQQEGKDGKDHHDG